VSGFVAVVSPGGDTTRPTEELRLLASHYRELRGSEPKGQELGSGGAAAAVAFGCEVTDDDAGWTVLQGSAHGRRSHPLTEAGLGDLDGQFSALSFARTSRAFLAATDAFAAAPVYVAERGDLVYCSTSALALARHLTPPASTSGMRHFLVTGAQFGPLTHWEGVRRLELGAALHVVDGTVTERFHWTPQPDPAVEGLSLSAAADHLLDVFVSTMRERLADAPSWLDLTGGYDSRLMALLAHRAGVSFTGNTRESSIQPDVRMARDIAQRKGWPWREMRVPWDWPDLLPRQAPRALAAGDGRLEVIQLSRVQWGHEQLAMRMPRLLSAGGGEHVQAKAWVSELPRPGRQRVNLELWTDVVGFRPVELAALAPGSLEATRAGFVDLVRPVAARYADQPSTRQLDACYAYKSSGHFGAYRAADDQDVVAQLPYYWKDTFAATFAMDFRHRSGFRLMRTMMERLDPEIARLPTTRGGPAVPMRPTTFHRYLPYYGLMGRKAVNKVGFMATGRTPFPFPVDPKWPEAESNAALVRHLVETGVLDLADLRVRPLLSDEGVRRLVAGELSSKMLGRVLTAEMALATTETSL
jgi:hypothetical protein